MKRTEIKESFPFYVVFEVIHCLPHRTLTTVARKNARLASPLKATALDVSSAKVQKIIERQSILIGKVKD